MKTCFQALLMKSKVLLSGFFVTLIGLLLLLQINVALALAADPDNPITSAITSAINAVVNTGQGQSNPSPVPSPTAAPSSDPVTSPITEATPSASPTSTPTPTPAPAAPVISSVSPNPATWGTVIVITSSNLTNSTKIYIDDSLVPPSFYHPASPDGTSISFTLPAFVNYASGQTYKLYVKNSNLKSSELDLSIAPSVLEETATPSATQVLINPQVNLDTNHPEVLVGYSNFNANISIPQSVANPTLNFSDILQTSAAAKRVSFNNMMTINSNTAIGTVRVEIPTATTISGPVNWDGIMNAPKKLDNTGIVPTASNGNIAITSSVIEVGLGDTPLTFDKAVRLLLPGQAGKLLGYQRGDNFTKITNSCSADSQAAGDNLPAGGNCYISNGNDLVVWTKHFTKFVTYTETPASGNYVTSSSTGSPEAPVCGDSKPVSSPKLVYAKASGRNEVTLVWSKALDPVSYYLVAYGTKPGTVEYGNPNVGGKDTISYVVKNLQNDQTYYFKVRAGNGCMPGDFSNEVAVKVSGDSVSGPATGFKSGVLSKLTPDTKFKPITEAKPAHITNSSTNIFAKVLNFLSHLFHG